MTARHLPMMLRFFRRMGYWPDAAWPRTHNERMLWRKIFDHNPEFATLSDKVAAKAAIAVRCPQLPQARLLWIGTDPDAAPHDVLAGDAMLKFNKGSSTNLVIRGGVPSREVAVRAMRRWLRRGRRREEWGYWSIEPKLLAEELLDLGGDGLPTDIKVHVCNGVLTHNVGGRQIQRPFTDAGCRRAPDRWLGCRLRGPAPLVGDHRPTGARCGQPGAPTGR
jgi:hypothetical protein